MDFPAEIEVEGVRQFPHSRFSVPIVETGRVAEKFPDVHLVVVSGLGRHAADVFLDLFGITHDVQAGDAAASRSDRD
jgi:hypothetical protein